MLLTELAQVLPREEPAVVAVVEDQLHGVLPDGLDRPDPDVLFAEHEDLLARAMPLHLGGRRMHAQVFERQQEARAVVECDFQHAGHGSQLDLGGLVGLRIHAGTRSLYSPRACEGGYATDGYRATRLLSQGRGLPMGLSRTYGRPRIHSTYCAGALHRRLHGEPAFERVPGHPRARLRPTL